MNQTMQRIIRHIAGARHWPRCKLVTPVPARRRPRKSLRPRHQDPYCSGVKQGEGRIAKCLGERTETFPYLGKSSMAATAGTDLAKVAAACGDDIHQFCAGAAPGTVKECLRTNFPPAFGWM